MIQIGPEIRQHAKCVTGHHCDVQNVTKCNRSLKQTVISDQSQFMRSRVTTQPVLAQETCWDSQTYFFKELHLNVSVRLEMDSRHFLQAHFLERKRTQADSNISKYDACNTTVDTRETFVGESSGHDEQHCRSLHETSGWIANTVAREETWTSNPGWYEWYEWRRLRNGDD